MRKRLCYPLTGLPIPYNDFMKINISIPSSYSIKQKAENVIRWMIDNHMPRKEWELNIIFTEREMPALGYCVAVVDHRYCEIHISLRFNEKCIIGTIIHELLHAKQYMMGQLKDIDSKRQAKAVWMGKVVKYNRNYKTLKNIIKYMPWERIAYSKTKVLYSQYHAS